VACVALKRPSRLATATMTRATCEVAAGRGGRPWRGSSLAIAEGRVVDVVVKGTAQLGGFETIGWYGKVLRRGTRNCALA
jgi:hypothetical protein